MKNKRGAPAVSCAPTQPLVLHRAEGLRDATALAPCVLPGGISVAPDQPQRMILRDPLLQIHVAEPPPPPKPCRSRVSRPPAPARTQESRTGKNRHPFPQPAKLI